MVRVALVVPGLSGCAEHQEDLALGAELDDLMPFVGRSHPLNERSVSMIHETASLQSGGRRRFLKGTQ